ncbi:MAG TPA: methyltransferase domain-containing protein [Caulifigura sp.]|jgi:phospholipid N-methyltransferase|nr:methyltransferase domain-containing protein [Caulifigura sp.]
MQLAPLTFLREFLHHPAELGTFLPSSRFLESRIVRLGGLLEDAVVVELGPGVGGTTTAILKQLPATARLIAIELNPDFIEPLNAIGDPRLVVHHGSAEDLQDVLDRQRLESADVIFSGIPFSTIPAEVGRSILENVWNSLSPGGRFIAYQLRSQVKKLARDFMGEPDVEFELLNLPPLWVYRWLKAPELVAEAADSLDPALVPA